MKPRTAILGVTAVTVALATLAFTDDPWLLLAGLVTAAVAMAAAYAATDSEPWWTSDPTIWQDRPDGWNEDRRLDR